MQTIRVWIKEGLGIALSFEVIRVKARPDNTFPDPGARHFYVTVQHQGRPECPVFSTFFSQGSAHDKAPTSWDIMVCLKSDAQCAGRTFEAFCDELGYDSDSRSAYNIWEATEKQTESLKKCLGPLWDSFMELEGE